MPRRQVVGETVVVVVEDSETRAAHVSSPRPTLPLTSHSFMLLTSGQLFSKPIYSACSLVYPSCRMFSASLIYPLHTYICLLGCVTISVSFIIDAIRPVCILSHCTIVQVLHGTVV